VALFYLYEPRWIDELADNFPDVPIILTKMGWGIRTAFDACTVIAKRNANVYFDLTDSRAEHVREAIDEIGAQRIIFGTDLHGLSLNYAYDVGFESWMAPIPVKRKGSGSLGAPQIRYISLDLRAD